LRAATTMAAGAVKIVSGKISTGRIASATAMSS
jgi:hypothetical protein